MLRGNALALRVEQALCFQLGLAAQEILVKRALPGTAHAFDDAYGTVAVGARMQWGGVQAEIGARTSVGQSGGSDSGVFLTLGGSF